jgi:AcrR family transcriptional regulator
MKEGGFVDGGTGGLEPISQVVDRTLRADAERNVERILYAARDVYAEFGPDAPIVVIAWRAGIAERTLYRRFPSKADLVRAAIDHHIAQSLMPAIDEARGIEHPVRGLRHLILEAMSLCVRDHHLLSAARRAGSLTPGVCTSFTTQPSSTQRSQPSPGHAT